MTSGRKFISRLTQASAFAFLPLQFRELVKICSITSSFGTKVFPHGHAVHAALHAVASQSPEVCPLVEYLILLVAHKMHFQKEPLLTTNGILRLPQKPGFGIEWDDSKIESQVILTQ